MALTKIQAAGLTADLIDETKLADNSLDSEHYNDGSIDHEHLANDCIDGDNLADNACDSEHYTDGSIDHEHLANDAVDADILADNSVGLAAMAHATDGVIITFDANGAPVYVGPGTDGQVLTSTGAGSPPAFENAAAGGLSDVVSDTSPQLGGNLDVNGKNIVFADSSGASDDRLILGASDDLQIYHSGNNIFDTKGQNIQFRNIDTDGNATDSMVAMSPNGSIYLYYDNNEKFKTTSTGTQTTGLASVDYTVTHTTGNYAALNLETLSSGTAGDDLATGIDFRVAGTNSTRMFATKDGKWGILTNDLGSYAIQTISDGSVELYHDNSKKLETTANGVDITGSLTTTDSLTVKGTEGSHGAIQLWSDEGDDNADKWKFLAHSGGDLQIQNYSTGSWQNSIGATGNGGVYLNYAGAEEFRTVANGVELTSDTNASGTTQTIYLTPTTTGSQARSCSIAAVNTDGNNNNALVFKTSAADTPAERLRITQSGEVRVPDGGKFTAGASDDLKIYHDGTTNIIEGLNGNMSIRPKTGENGILVRNDSSVDLYYDDSKKFETTSYGAKVTGKLHHAGIVQVVSSVYQSNRMTTSSNSYVDAWSAVNITPVSSSSKVLVRVTGTAFSISGSATLGMILRRTVGGSVTGTSPIGNNGHGNITSPDGATIGLYQGDDGSSNVMQTPFSIEWIDSPSTTSTITYDLWIASNNSSGTVGIGGMGNSEDYNTATTIVAMEIGA